MPAPIGSARHPNLVCTATGKAGKPCRGYRAAGSTLCRFHQPEAEGDRQKARDAHVEAAKVHRADGVDRLVLESAEDVRQLIEQTATRLRAGLIPAATAVALDRLARTALAAIDSRLLEEAQAEIQASKAAQPAGVRRR